MATWNNAGRPIKPKTGTVGFNTETQRLEIWTGSTWYTVSNTTEFTQRGKGGFQNPNAAPELSKNTPTYLSLGNGLSILVGLPRIPTWNTPGKPKKPLKGMMGFNTQTQKLEIWNGNVWYSVSMKLL